MTESESPIRLYVSKDVVPILWTCAKHFSDIPTELTKVAASLLAKLAEELAADDPSPYDPLLTLTPEEASELESALRLMMSDAKNAFIYGDVADEYVGKVRLSSLASHRSSMADLLRRLDVAIELAAHEQRLLAIERTLNMDNKPPKSG